MTGDGHLPAPALGKTEGFGGLALSRTSQRGIGRKPDVMPLSASSPSLTSFRRALAKCVKEATTLRPFERTAWSELIARRPMVTPTQPELDSITFYSIR
jgi:hypothetical protein